MTTVQIHHESNIMNQPINTFKSLDEIFDTNPTPIAPLVPVEEKSLPVPVSNQKEELDFPAQSELMDDYKLARENIRTMLEQGSHVVENMIQIASQTESARSFEVAGNLIKAMSELSKDLISLHEQTQKAKRPAKEEKTVAPQQINNTQNNNIVFQGTTTDLLKMVGNTDVIE